jgi:hypothetical protein
VSAMHPSDRTYRSTTVRLSELAVVADTIENVTFENCTLVGPAVLALMETTMTQSSLEGDPESILWVIPDERQRLLGAIGLLRCNIVGCQLQRIGLVVPARELDGFKRGLGL